MTNELDSPDSIPAEPPVNAESAPTKPRRWRWFMAGVLSTVLVAGGVVGIVEVTKPKGVTPASINAAMAKFCGKKTVYVTIGLEDTTKHWGASNKRAHSGVVGSIYCDANALTLFFRTA